MTKSIPLTQGKVTLVDDADYEWLNQWKWQALRRNNTWYATRTEGSLHKKGFRIHREIMKPPAGMLVDHINGDGLDNRRENLRICTQAENMMNRGRTKSNTSGFKGVSWKKHQGKYEATVISNGKRVYLGLFYTAEDAARAYDEAARVYHGDFARLNFEVMS